jgi:NodT family efflux transporter outer membrane factor (OMF) lipoprotein
MGLALAGVSLAACKAVGPDFAPPAPPTVTGYQMQGDAPNDMARLTPDARAAGAWWKSFGSAELDQVMDKALAGNQTVAAADASLERLRDELAATHGAQAPQVTANAGIQAERINIASLGFAGFPNPTLGLYSIGGQVSYDVDLFGGLRRATEAAAARAESQARQADAAYLTLTGQTTMTALEIGTTRAEITAVEQAIDDDKRLLDIVRQAVEAGGQAPAASNSVEAQLAQDEALLPPLRAQLSRSRHALAELVGEAPANWAPPDFDLASFTAPTEVPVSVPSSLVRRRPDILAAEANLHAATADIGVATAALYPDIKLSANMTQTIPPPGNLLVYGSSGWQVGAGLVEPLLNGGSLKASRRAAQAEARVALAQYRSTVVTAFTQVSDAMEAISEDDAEITALTQAQTTAMGAVRDDEIAFRYGGGPLLTIMDDQRRLQLARQALARAQGQRLADIARLYVATAADWREAKS